MSTDTPLAIDEFIIEVDLERGPVGVGFCYCRLPEGRRLNFDAAEAAFEHTHNSSSGIEATPCFKMVVFEIQLNPQDEDAEAQRLHVETTAEGVLAGVVDYLAQDGTTLVCDSDAAQSFEDDHREMIKELAS